MNDIHAEWYHNIFSGDSDARVSDVMAHLMQYTWAARPASVIFDKGAGVHVPDHRTVLFAL